MKDEGSYWRAFYSRDSRLLVTLDLWRAARVWDATTGEPLTPRLLYEIDFAEFSPDNRYVLTSGRDGKVHLWELATGKSVSVPLTNGDTIFRASFSPDGRRIAAGGFDGTVRIWNLAAVHGSALDLTDAPEILFVNWRRRATLSPDGLRVATMGDDAAVRVRDAQTGRMIFPPRWHSVLPSDSGRGYSDNWSSSVVFSRDGTRIGSQSKYNFTAKAQEKPYLFEARVWDAATGKPLTPALQIEGAKSAGVVEAYFDPDCTRLLVLRPTNQVEVLDMATAKLMYPPLQHAGIVTPLTGIAVQSASFSPDGGRIVTTDFEKTGSVRSGRVQVWRADTGAKIGAPFTFTENTNDTRLEGLQFKVWVKYVGFSPDGRRVVAVTLDRFAHLLDAQTGRLIFSFPTQGAQLERVVFSPDGRRLLTEGAKQTTRIWDAATGHPLTPMLRNAGIAWCNSFSLDGRTVLTAGENGWPRVWDAQTGAPITPHPPPLYGVGYPELSSDARRVLMACYDGHARIWELNEDQRPAADLVLLARVLSGQEIDANGSLSPLEPAALSNAWQTLRLKYPAAFTATPDDLVGRDWDEAEAAAKAKQWSAALFHLDHLIKVQPKNGLYWSRRGYAHAALTNWNAAAADFSEAIKLDVDERRVLKSCALAQLAAENIEGYRKTCQALVKTLDLPDGMRAGPEVALICLLATNGPSEAEGLQAFIERGASDQAWAPYYRLPTGLLLYRGGRFEEALAKLTEATPAADDKRLPVAWPLLAMTHFRLGQTDAAQRRLHKADAEIRGGEPKPSQGTFEPPWWEKHLVLELPFREAKHVISP